MSGISLEVVVIAEFHSMLAGRNNSSCSPQLYLHNVEQDARTEINNRVPTASIVHPEAFRGRWGRKLVDTDFCLL